MKKAKRISRRAFLAAASAVSGMAATSHPTLASSSTDKPALLGGPPVRTDPFPSPSWPIYGAEEEQALVDAVRSGSWFRGYSEPSTVKRFEAAELAKA